MKKIAAILLIVAILVQSTSQVWITVAFTINQDYIAANLCINRFEAIPLCKGACYLEKQLNEDRQQQQKLPDLKTKEVNLFCQTTPSDLHGEDLDLGIQLSYPNYKQTFTSAAYLRSVFRPPSLLFS